MCVHSLQHIYTHIVEIYVKIHTYMFVFCEQACYNVCKTSILLLISFYLSLIFTLIYYKRNNTVFYITYASFPFSSQPCHINYSNLSVTRIGVIWKQTIIAQYITLLVLLLYYDEKNPNINFQAVLSGWYLIWKAGFSNLVFFEDQKPFYSLTHSRSLD